MSKPFTGLSFCCTGVNSYDRKQLGERISALGGKFQVDLMSLVQYLVVGDRNTEKYKFCVRYRHDIQFISLSTVTDACNSWNSGKNIIVSKDLHPLPAFANFKICVARIDRPPEEELRKLMSERFRQPPKQAVPNVLPEDPFLLDSLASAVSKLGANVSQILSMSCNVVVATSVSGKRGEIAKQWNIPIVHPLWIYDSCLREAALHLQDYELSPQFNAYNSTSFVWKQLYLSRIFQEHNTQIADRLAERLLLKKKPEIWTSIMDSAHPLLTKEAPTDTWEESRNSDTESKEPDVVDDRTKSSLLEETQSTLFQGLSFLPIGLTVPEQNILRTVLESHQGKVITSSEDSDLTHVVMLVRNGPQTELMLLMFPSTIKHRINNKKVKIVTNWFVERSIFYNKLCDDMWARPMLGIVPLKIKRQVCITGFTGVELLHLEKLISYLNLEFCESLNAKRDLLVVNINLFKSSFSKSSPKLFEYRLKEVIDCPVYANGNSTQSVSTLSLKNKMIAAKKWGVPIVSVAYLWEMVAILEGQPNLMIPDIRDLQWCIFAPKSGTNSSKFMVSLSETPSILPNTDNMESSYSNVRLPSPKKFKDRKKYGRIFGRGESLLKKLQAARDLNDDADREPPSGGSSSQDFLTVGYGIEERAEKDKRLLAKLEGTGEKPTKRPRRASHKVEYLK
ncbi:hypothetical protein METBISCDRAFT_26912 [Metschnikowia bicuspidata]|uniref:BRCT domain-containing protein n=1 Tax=Metschnikowia bicuspidata TaxID=27322 RepID=A0A4P9ZDR3_9ASCO|nr:hypothetical protein METBISCDRAFT_26912 [Metschnikowia bicuspidata]